MYILYIISEWEVTVNLTKIRYNAMFSNNIPHDIEYNNIDDLIDKIIEIMPNGGCVLTHLNHDDYHNLLLGLNARNVINKYYTVTVYANMRDMIETNNELYQNNIIINSFLSTLELTSSNRLLNSIGEYLNMNLKYKDYYNLKILANLYSICETLKLINLNLPSLVHYVSYYQLYSYKFKFPSGDTTLDKTNYFRQWIYQAKSYYKNNEYITNLTFSHIVSQNPYPTLEYKCDVTLKPYLTKVQTKLIAVMKSALYEENNKYSHYIYYYILFNHYNAEDNEMIVYILYN